MIKEYLTYIKEVRNLSDATIEGYGKDLKEFVIWAQANGLRWSTLREQDCDIWLMDMQRRGLKAATRNRRLSALRQLLTWAHNKGILQINAARFCQSAKKEETLRETLDIEAIDLYLANYQPSTEAFIAALLISMMLETGLRISEAINVRSEDIDPHLQRIKVTGKGRKERFVFYGERTKKMLSFFLSGVDGRLLPEWEPQDFREIIERELYPYVGKMTPHQLRHTFATKMLNNGMPITTLSSLLGHKKIETTQIYAKVATSTTEREYNQFKF